jgi:hypothetical protein
MTRWAIVALILMAGTATTQPPPQQPTEGWAYKLLAVDGKPVKGHDFGTVPAGAQLNHKFEIKNIWSVPLRIQTSVSCDCLKVTLPKEVLQKNETGSIDVDMDGRRFQGQKSVNLFVTLVEDSPRPRYQSTAQLTITANARMDVTLNPGSVNFGIINIGQPAQPRYIDVDYAGQLNWQIVGVPKSDLFDISVVQRIRAPGRIGYQVGLTVKPDAPAGKKKDELLLQTNDPASPTVPIPFEITLLSPLQLTQDKVKLPPTQVGAEVTSQKIMLSGTRPFKITGIDGIGEGLEQVDAMASGPRNFHYLKFKLTPKEAGHFSRKVTIKTDCDKDATATITIEGDVTN